MWHSSCPHSLNCGVLQAHSRSLPGIHLPITLLALASIPPRQTWPQPVSDFCPLGDLALKAESEGLGEPKLRLGARTSPTEGCPEGTQYAGTGAGCGNQWRQQPGQSQLDFTFPAQLWVFSFQLMKLNISQNCLLSLSGQAAAHVDTWGPPVLSGVCWSALGWCHLCPSLKAQNWSPVPLDINRTLLRPARFAFSCQTPGIFSL